MGFVMSRLSSSIQLVHNAEGKSKHAKNPTIPDSQQWQFDNDRGMAQLLI